MANNIFKALQHLERWHLYS